MRKFAFIAAAVLSAVGAFAQEWTLEDVGAGLIRYDGGDEPRIVRRGALWDFEELLSKGAFRATPDGGEEFAVWIAGPRTDTFLDAGGTPVWSYSYVITWPDGTASDFGRYGFPRGGAAYFLFQPGRFLEGKFRVDFFVHSKVSGEKRPAGSVAFEALRAAPAAVAGAPAAAIDAGVGLVVLGADYDRALKVLSRGGAAPWKVGELLGSGALNGRTDGKPHFCAWLVVPPSASSLDESGRPKWGYTYRVVAPDGKAWESGFAYFYAPGFACVQLEIGGYPAGSWRVEFSIVDARTKAKHPVAPLAFATALE